MQSTGTKRVREYSDGEPVAKRAKGPDEKFDDLVGKLKNGRLGKHLFVSGLLSLVAGQPQSAVDNFSPDSAQHAFMALIEAEEFAVFAEAFTLYQEARRKEPYVDDDGKPEKLHKLHIRLASDWAPSDPEAMVAAFSQLHVETLTIRAEHPRQSGPCLVSAVVSQCMVCWLDNGLTDLTIEGGLLDAAPVAQALSRSQLTALVLKFNPNGYRFGSNLGSGEWNSHTQLSEGLLSCRSLKHLTLSHTIEGAKNFFAGFDQKGAPPLESLTLSLKNVGVFDEHGEPDWAEPRYNEALHVRDAAETMKSVALLPRLSSLSVSIPEDVPGMLTDVFFTPLENHPRLVGLSIIGGTGVKQSVNILTNVARFTASCPELLHFSCEHREDYRRGGVTEYIQAFTDAGGDIEAPADGEVEVIMAARTYKLQTLKLGRAILASGQSSGFLRALARNTSIVRLDLFDCTMDLKVAVGFLRALHTCLSLDQAKLPTLAGCYYWLRSDGRALDFDDANLEYGETFDLADVDDEVSDDEEGHEHERLVQSAAVSAFEQMRAEANELLVGIRNQLADNRKAFAVSHLAPSLQYVLAASVHAQDAGRGTFDGIAQRVMSYLVDANATATGVHLPEVVKAARTHSESMEGPVTRARLQKQVAMDRKRNVIKTREEQEAQAAQRQVEADALNLQLAMLSQRSPPGDGVLADLSPVDTERLDLALKAIQQGDVDALLDLIDDGLALNVVQPTTIGAYANVLLAASSNNPDMLRILTQAGASDFGGWVGVTSDEPPMPN